MKTKTKFEKVVVPDKKGAKIKVDSKHIGKVAEVTITDKNELGITDKQAKKIADKWDKGSI